MILCDFNLISIMSIISWCNKHPKNDIAVKTAINVIYDNLDSYYLRFKDKYGQMILACDSRSYWRKDFFPYYKIKRKESREKSSNVNWDVIHSSIDGIREASYHRPYFYPFICVKGAEADDVIAVLTQAFASKEEILILSSDKDFVQLQKSANVTQYNPQFNRFVSVQDPIAFTREHIIRGDYGDSIPNFLSSDDTIANGERQKSINTQKLQEWVTKDDPDDFCDTNAKKLAYARNRMLIDFDYIPKHIRETILTEYYGKTQ